ncbi:MAG: LmbE family protein [Verrucomicrobia bacterium]|nr:LmbE family protein [Verrucomicrobiota bacterium]
MVKSIALAVGAHPDDIEFKMAGALLLLREAGWDTHYWTLSSGNCGSQTHGPAETARRRRLEARRAAGILGARWHAPLCRDLEIIYDVPLLRRVAAKIREIQPSIILTHPPVDYMEDHTETCRLVVTAAFAHAMPNFKVTPARPIYQGDVAVYHCLPHGLCDPLRRPVRPDFFIDTTSFRETLRASRIAHASQFDWLKQSQGMDSMIRSIEAESFRVGKMSGKFRQAEGWWRHAHAGFGSEKFDPLRVAAGKRCTSARRST